MPHVYSDDGTPHFHLSAAQAKKEGLFFSVTEHQKVLAKPALEHWKLNEHLKTAHQNPPRGGEDEAAYAKRVKQLNWKNGGGAAALGTKIHEALESVFALEQAKQVAKAAGKNLEDLEPTSAMKCLGDLDVQMRPFVTPALNWFNEKQFEILEIEKTLVNKDEGYAGTVDLAVLTPCGKKSVIDWKSRKTAGRKIQAYPENSAQCAAYAAAYFGPEAVENKQCWAANVIISTDEKSPEGDARFAVITYTPDEVAYHYDTFRMTCELWRRTEGYDPRKERNK